MNRLNRFLNSVSDAIAPQATKSLLDEFKGHWSAVQRFYTKSVDESIAIHLTGLPERLEALVAVLRQEESEGDGKGETGPVMEYFLQVKVFETLTALGTADCPIGMKGLVLRSLAGLFGSLRQPLIPHVAIHKPLTVFLTACADDIGVKSPARSDLIALVCSLLNKLQRNPGLIGFFLEPVRAPPPGHMGSGPTPAWTFLLGKVLLYHINDSVVETGDRARAGIMTALMLDSPDIQAYFMGSSSLSKDIVEGLVSAFTALPATMTSEADRDRREVFLQRVLFCNAIVREASRPLAALVLESVSTHFLSGVVEPALMQPAEKTARVATEAVIDMLGMVDAPSFINTLGVFLIGDSVKPEKRPVGGAMAAPAASPPGSKSSEGPHLLRGTLIRRMDSLSDVLSLSTLRLFDGLLSLQSRHIVFNLIVRNLTPLKHLGLDGGDGSDGQQSAAKAESIQKFLELAPHPKGMADPGLIAAYHTYRTDAEAHMALSLPAAESWELADPEEELEDLSLLGESVVTSPTFSDKPDTLFPEMPRLVKGPEVRGSNSPPPDAFYEGAFLEVLFNRVERMLDTGMEINIAVSGLFYSLAQHPHPLLHTYLLESSTVVPEARTLFRILEAVSKESRERGQALERFEERAEAVRKSLGVVAPKEGEAVVPVTEKNEPELEFLQGVIVMEQFALELAAVLQAKTHLSRHDADMIRRNL